MVHVGAVAFNISSAYPGRDSSTSSLCDVESITYHRQNTVSWYKHVLQFFLNVYTAGTFEDQVELTGNTIYPQIITEAKVLRTPVATI